MPPKNVTCRDNRARSITSLASALWTIAAVAALQPTSAKADGCWYLFSIDADSAVNCLIGEREDKAAEARKEKEAKAAEESKAKATKAAEDLYWNSAILSAKNGVCTMTFRDGKIIIFERNTSSLNSGSPDHPLTSQDFDYAKLHCP